ncbi:helix-turn-helix domain-containing protein [Hymenobacter wooponensis]|uniref:AraC family transcriptional regulator n=1 Tax=Hymenobacter wooponensis TaxID=1525360 RepID=A0A4Z0MDQ6_9BACT|nr:AraC family transcriptional regulator [Hymenobacter wooponensis]TGD77646.1 AraC family transcriptional regulator [Hymenobacter wooponensis]
MQFLTDQFKTPALVSSASLPWQGLRIEQIHLPSATLPAIYYAEHVLVLHQVAEPLVIRRRRAGQVQKTVYRTGDLGLYPGGDHAAEVDWATPRRNIYLTLDHRYLAQLVREDASIRRFALCERLKFKDPLLNQLIQQLLQAAGSQRALGRFYVESLTNALCQQLIEHHATYQRPSRQPRLPAAALARIQAYLEAHPEAPVTLQTLAGLANLSIFHFARLFKHATGVSPYQYVVQSKMQRAKHLLRQGGATIDGISDALGFASAKSFVAAFTRAVGCTPQQYQRG